MKESSNEMTERKEIRTRLTNFAKYTTLHGMNRLASNKRILGKVVWSNIILVCAGFCTRQIYELCVQYASKSVNTRISIRYQTVYFPYVSLCNLNPVSFSRMNSTYNSDFYAASLMYYFVKSIKMYMKDNNSTVNETTTKEFKDVSNAEQMFRQSMNFFDFKPLNFTIDGITRVNPDFEDFVISCIYDGHPCNKSDFVPFFDHYYGLCYRFPSERKVSQRSGPLFALQLKLNVNQSDYIPGIIQDAGIKLSIHKPGTEPFLQNTGISLATGLKTDISVVQKSVEKLPGRSICDNSGRFNSRLDCFEQCRLAKVIQQCKCSMYLFKNRTNKDPASCYNDEEFRCMDNVLQNMSDCKCLSPCSQTKYEHTITSSGWPASKFEDTVKEILEKRGLNYSRDSVLAVNIFLSSLLEEVTVEEPATTVENLMSNIGGTLGLWIGMSIISFGEILELVYLLCKSVVTGKRQNKTNDVKPKYQTNDDTASGNDEKNI